MLVAPPQRFYMSNMIDWGKLMAAVRKTEGEKRRNIGGELFSVTTKKPFMTKNMLSTIYSQKVDTVMVPYTGTWIHGEKRFIIFGTRMRIFSLELAKIQVDGGLVELYGYIAAWDGLDPLPNYIVNISRDDPITVEQGSLINMVGPKRGIDMMDYCLIEFDMRIKTGKQEKDDLQLIDGATSIGPAGQWSNLFTVHIPGDYGIVGITLSCLEWAAEATIEVNISEVKNGFNLLFGCLTSGMDKEIRLFDGDITESRGLKRSVVAVKMGSLIELKIKVGALPLLPLPSSFYQHCCFEAKVHGHDTQEIKTAFALISVKVTWSTLPRELY